MTKKAGRPRGRPKITSLDANEIQAIRYRMLGYNKKEALRKAGYPEDYISKSHHDFFKRRHIEAELYRRKNKMIEAHEVTEDRIIQQIAKIAFADLADVIEVDEDGIPAWNFTGKESYLGAIIGGLQVDEYMEGKGPGGEKKRKVRISQKDQLAALRTLARIKGMEQTKVSHNVDADLIERLNAGRSRVSSAEDGDDSVGGGG